MQIQALPVSVTHANNPHIALSIVLLTILSTCTYEEAWEEGSIVLMKQFKIGVPKDVFEFHVYLLMNRSHAYYIVHCCIYTHMCVNAFTFTKETISSVPQLASAEKASIGVCTVSIGMTRVGIIGTFINVCG